MKQQWQSMSEDQIKRFAEFSSRKQLVGMYFGAELIQFRTFVTIKMHINIVTSL